MGTHPSGPAKILASRTLLSEWLKDKPHLVGTVPEGYPANDLPFLFKVLSVDTALSIQAHPDKTLAQQLHARAPEHYKDGNHKPEMVIALTKFECLCSFRELSSSSNTSIVNLLAAYPEFHHLLKLKGFDINESSKEGSEQEVLRSLFRAYMESDPRDIVFQLNLLIERLEGQQGKKHPLADLDNLILRLHSQYPGDLGVFSPLLLNYVVLEPGQSFFLAANEPHAYLSGDCVECMALSDNVVRAGLTPKFKDVETLCSMLTYKAGMPFFLTPSAGTSSTKIYRPLASQCAEFELEMIEVPAASTQPLLRVPGGSILLVLEGGEVGLALTNPSASFENCFRVCSARNGVTVFLAADAEVTVTAGSKKAVLVRAHVNLST
eukprot:scaffold2224_cov175-Ochromonas_danica.AAC.3